MYFLQIFHAVKKKLHTVKCSAVIIVSSHFFYLLLETDNHLKYFVCKYVKLYTSSYKSQLLKHSKLVCISVVFYPNYHC